ncbi:hypothetical protein DSCW_50610 [Desulfosarcina widdelii]|uniref:Alpha-L-glutamate ligase-related protein ATP-grasp domain-containing protein n=1 Tax=Desulfosarcina widdelii TaxID=947919 RepID=A0A5K7ZH34_9BACT|nr:sugar-transfer associated ATP-grasp domain-containing protein [Desulfosarcina widdelii]BBO77644.1 hypothetical protein DSCW_50610 [Desulfosarcina widdelii]
MKPLNYIPKFVTIPWRMTRFFIRLIHYSYRPKRRFDGDSLRLFYKLIKLYVSEGYTPEESYHYGFLYKNITEKNNPTYVSRKKMSVIQRKINPVSWAPLTEEKGIFYRICTECKIPIPKLFGIVFNNLPGWSYKGSQITNIDEWNRFIINDIPDEFVLKPSRGVYGKGIKIYKRNADLFTDEKNTSSNAESIYRKIRTDPEYNTFVIQERIRNHQDFNILSQSEYLQTARVITNIRKDGTCHIVYAYLKLIVGANIVDNQNYGRTGNLLSKININSGSLEETIYLSSKPHGIEILEKHPESGFQLNQFSIPHWEDVCQTAINAAHRFSPIQAIGWDIAVAEKGPVVIEGNTWFDPPKFGDIEMILAEIKK